MTQDTLTVATRDASDDARWTLAGRFLDALTRRDFPALQSCLHPDVRMRALAPPGPFELNTAVETVARFHTWFGEAELFEVLEASIGQVGELICLQWRARRGNRNDPESFEIVEQHVFATVRDTIETIDLLCSGFQAQYEVPR
jgi:hypothetical protein